MQRSSMAFIGAVSIALAAASWATGDGLEGPLYLPVFAALVLPGLPLGFALFGWRHPAGWIAGALLGYALALVALWAAIKLSAPTRLGFLAALLITLALTWAATRTRTSPAVALPSWTPQATRSLAVVLLVTLALAAPPLANVGRRDADGNVRYRAYFIADFVWHSAMTAELTRFALPPRNPYLAPQQIHYYWGYFLVPAVIAQAGPAPLQDVERCLKLNALITGVLFLSSIYVAAFVAVRSAMAAAAGTLLALLSASMEGLYEVWRLWSRHRPLAAVRDLNIDALTAWDFFGHRIDGLPRCLWYVPQHSMAYALGIIALTVVAAEGEATLAAIAVAGVALGGSTLVNPFVGGMFSIAWGIAAALRVWHRDGIDAGRIGRHALAIIPVALAVAWCVGNRMVEGAGHALEFGLWDASRHAPVTTLLLSFGPVLLAAAGGLVFGPRSGSGIRLLPAIVLASLSFLLMYFVRLNVDHQWVPFRAGQMLLAALAVLGAAFFAAPQRPAARRAVLAIGLLLLMLGLPTTVIDAYNAHDINNLRQGQGSGGRWCCRAINSRPSRGFGAKRPAMRSCRWSRACAAGMAGV